MDSVKFWQIKKELRVLGIDDAPFPPHTKEKVLVVGAVLRGGQWLDGVLSTNVQVDGVDATPKIIEMINTSRHKDQLRVIMLDGVTIGGFNVLDTEQVFKEIGLPLIVVTRKKPSLQKIKKALQNLPDWKKRWRAVQAAGEFLKAKTKQGKQLYMQIKGIERSDAEKIVRLTATRGNIPEPIRVAHLIASGITLGESIGRA